MAGNGKDGNNILIDDDVDDNNGDGGRFGNIDDDGNLIFGDDGNGFNCGVFLRGCTGLSLQHTHHSSRDPSSFSWKGFCQSSVASINSTIFVIVASSLSTLLITFVLFILSYCFAFSSKTLSCIHCFCSFLFDEMR